MDEQTNSNLQTLVNIIKIYETTYSQNENLQDIVMDLKKIAEKINNKLEC